MKSLFLAMIIPFCQMHAERKEDFKEQDRIFKNCQLVFKAEKLEKDLLQKCQKESSKKYLSRREKAKEKSHENS